MVFNKLDMKARAAASSTTYLLIYLVLPFVYTSLVQTAPATSHHALSSIGRLTLASSRTLFKSRDMERPS
jgi:hypothetical protein